MTEFKLASYVWRGKTYKTMHGLFAAVCKAYPGAAMSFTRDTMVLAFRDGPHSRSYKTFDRTFEAGMIVISDQPVAG